MAIFGNVGLGVEDVLAGDTVLMQPSASQRWAITGASFYNDTGAAVTITLFSSPDGTSASGDQVDSFSVPANDSVEPPSILGQGYANGENLIAVGSAIGVNASLTVAKYTDGD